MAEMSSVLDHESILVKLRRIGRSQAGKLLAGGVDHVQIAIGAIVPSEPYIALAPCALAVSICRIVDNERTWRTRSRSPMPHQNGEVAFRQLNRFHSGLTLNDNFGSGDRQPALTDHSNYVVVTSEPLSELGG